MRILLDVDGVLADFRGRSVQLIRDLGGPDLSLVDNILTDWNIFHHVPDELEPIIEYEWRRKGFCASLPVFPGAQEFVQSLRDQGHEIFFVTSPINRFPEFWMPERAKWLRNNFSADEAEIVFCRRKHIVLGDVLLDDRYENVKSWHDHHPNKLSIQYLINLPADPELDGILRVNTYDDVLSSIDLRLRGII